MKTITLALAGLVGLLSLHATPASAAPDTRQRQMSLEDIEKARHLLEADRRRTGHRPPIPVVKTDPFFDALRASDREVKKAYASFDYEAVVRSRQAFLKAWGAKLPRAPQDRKKARAAIVGCKREITYARGLSEAWKQVETNPARHLAAFLHRLLHTPASAGRYSLIPALGDRPYSEAERQGLVDLVVATFPKAKAWRDARFPAVLKLARPTDSEIENLVRAALNEKLGAYGWKVRNGPDAARDLPVLDVSVTTRDQTSQLHAVMPVAGNMVSLKVEMHLVLHHDATPLEDRKVVVTELGLAGKTTLQRTIEHAVLNFRRALADELIQAVADGTLDRDDAGDTGAGPRSRRGRRR